MTASDNNPGPALDGDTIAGTYVLCPKCGYCLKGLPKEGVCPECGTAYVAKESSLETALREFNECVPGRFRLWLRPRAEHLPSRLGLFARFLLAAGLVSILFAATQVGTSWVGYRLHVRKSDEPPYQENWRVLENAVMYIYRDRHDRNIAAWEWHLCTLGVVEITFVGQLALAIGVQRAYARAARGAPAHRRLMRRLAGCAACGVPFLFVPPMLVIVLWQLVNTAFPVSAWGESYMDIRTYDVVALAVAPLLSYVHLVFRAPKDRVFLIGAAALLVACIAVSIRFRRVHRTAVRRIVDKLTYVRRRT